MILRVVAVIGVPLVLVATVVVWPRILTALPSLVVDLLLAIIVLWPVIAIRALKR